MSPPPLAVLILAAGKGTRMKSKLPKVLHSVCGKSLVMRAISACAKLQPKEIIVVVGYEKEKVENEIKKNSQDISCEIKTVFQKEQNGTGHAAQVALEKITGSEVLIIPGDMPLITSDTLNEVVDSRESSNLSLVFMSAVLDEPFGYGRVVKSNLGEVAKIVEEKDCGEEEKKIKEVNVSVYCAKKDFLEEALLSLKDDNAQGELYLTDIIAFAVENKKELKSLIVKNSDEVLGANTKYELALLEERRRVERIKELAEDGVSFEDVSSVYVDEDVEILSGAFIGAGTKLKGKTKISKDVYIEGNSFFFDTEIGESCEIKFSCHFDSAIVGENCILGPFARLRPGARLKSGVKIGNFVEIKNSEIACGAKVSHLSYVGDASLGEEVNVGAGTITCNYDGYKKSRTEIKKGTMIGSNTSLVAPVVIGENAYVGAGSVIKKDVPDGSLSVERAEQKNIIGWTKRKKSENRG